MKILLLLLTFCVVDSFASDSEKEIQRRYIYATRSRSELPPKLKDESLSEASTIRNEYENSLVRRIEVEGEMHRSNSSDLNEARRRIRLLYHPLLQKLDVPMMESTNIYRRHRHHKNRTTTLATTTTPTTISSTSTSPSEMEEVMIRRHQNRRLLL